ncbi:polysaccharide biosynthesis protein [Idiomarina tyrosinivorans]|uniref:Polysaccharide biosynthesis protein n=1 Tax=Idiomarina tyrosinivorans TaxID=1445662 RepID=A0A432ZQT5_9GAMM|nr:SLBB domain-containing protein [Idiomarina tyrosinivorans]RUO80274.1 polysaccharide biosynthesis protein [Idiomarina tyrosinivorans]
MFVNSQFSRFLQRMSGALLLMASLFMVAVVPTAAQTMPTQQQLEQFKKLPRAQQQALAQQYGIDLSQLSQDTAQQTGPTQQTTDTVNPRLEDQQDAMGMNIPLDQLTPAQLAERLNEEDRKLKPFGYDIFAGQPSTYAPVSNAPVPANYLVGIGDSLRVQLFGKENNQYVIPVTREGTIVIPGLAPINVAGLHYDEVKALISSTVKERMIGMDAAVSMAELRSMQVFVVGEAYQPGAYTVSSLTTISQALFLSGGVSDIASLRNIQLKRNGKVVTNFDLYDLLTKGDNSHDLLLRHGDVVFIPARGPMVTVAGEVTRPALYEIVPGETWGDVLAFAGGVLPSGYEQAAQLLRYNGGERTVETVNLTKNADELVAKGGDELMVNAVSQQVNKGISVIGAVSRPGYYEFNPGKTIQDILPSVEKSLLPITDLGYGLVVRQGKLHRISVLQFNVAEAIAGKPGENLTLQANDKILLFSRYEAADAEKNQLDQWLRTESDIAKEEREEVIKQYRKNFLAGLLQSDEEALTLDENDQPQRLESFDRELESIFDNQTEEEKAVKQMAEAQRGPDYYSKYSRHNLLQPVLYKLRNQYSSSGTLPLFYVDGEVQTPGVYPLAENSNAQRAVEAAGGLKESAYLKRADITRTEIIDGEATTQYVPVDLAKVMNEETTVPVQGRDQINILTIPSWQNTLKVTLAGEVKFPGTYNIRRGETLSELINRAGGLTQYAFERGAVFTREDLRETEQLQLENLAQQLRREIASNMLTDNGANVSYSELNKLLEDMTRIEAVGRLIINLDDVLAANPNSPNNIQLKDGDRLMVPTVKNTVSIIGEVQLPSSYRYQAGVSLEDYIAKAGGLREKGDEERIYVIKANGAIELPDSSWFAVNQDLVEPGDTIVVPLDSQYVNNIQLWSTTTQIMYQIGVALAAFANL